MFLLALTVSYHAERVGNCGISLPSETKPFLSQRFLLASLPINDGEWSLICVTLTNVTFIYFPD